MNATETKFVAVEKSIAGNDLYFTGIERFDLLHSKYPSHARAFDSAEQALAAVESWNRCMGHKFTVRTFPEFAEVQAHAAKIRALLA